MVRIESHGHLVNFAISSEAGDSVDQIFKNSGKSGPVTSSSEVGRNSNFAILIGRAFRNAHRH